MRNKLRRMFGGGRRRRAMGGEGGEQAFPVDERDRSAVEGLKARGIDPSRPQRIRHTLTFANREGADEAAERLRGRGFDVQVESGAGDHGPVLVARQQTVLDLDAIAQIRGRLTRFAGRHGGEYEGWQVDAAS
jgi:hypothetical protein